MDNTGWLSGTFYCNWATVECDSNGNVYSLILFANGLQGAFPPGRALAPLTRLQTLGLDYNNISGDSCLQSIAEANLTALSYLGLTGNSISGVVPWKELAQGSPRLSDLLLSFNNLQGEIPPDLAQMGRWSDGPILASSSGDDNRK